MRLRQQLPVYSPVHLKHCLQAVRDAAVRRGTRRELAAHLEAVYGADRAILCASGVAALGLALATALEETGPEGPVALPAFGCYDVVTAAIGAGARILFYDIDPATLGPDFASLSAVLESGARVVTIAPLYGVPVDWDAVERCLAPYGAVVVEDAAQGHGAEWKGRRLGSLGRWSVLSFGRGKGWTGGRGGVLLTRSTEPPYGGRAGGAAQGGSIGELSTLGLVLAQWALGRPGIYGLPASLPWLGLGETRYREPRPPARMARVAAALVAASELQAAEEAATRRAHARWFLERLGPVAGLRVYPATADGRPGYLRFPLLIEGGLSRLRAPAAEVGRLGLAASYPSTLPDLPAARRCAARARGGWPGAERLVRDLVTLPTHSRVSEWERERIVELFRADPS